MADASVLEREPTVLCQCHRAAVPTASKRSSAMRRSMAASRQARSNSSMSMHDAGVALDHLGGELTQRPSGVRVHLVANDKTLLAALDTRPHEFARRSAAAPD